MNKPGLLFLSCLLTGATVNCGGKAPPPSAPAAPAATQVETALTEVTEATEPALPAIPQSPAPAPKDLSGIISINARTQLSKIAKFADQLQPGMGAFIAEPMVLRGLTGVIDADNLVGYDASKVISLLAFDDEHAVFLAAVEDEQALRDSLGDPKDTPNRMIIHDGYVAIGSAEDLVKVAPYALSNLAKQATAEEPTITVFVQNAVNARIDEIRAELTNNLGQKELVDFAMNVLQEVQTVEIAAKLTEEAVGLEMVASLTGNGHLQSFVKNQAPSDFSALKRLGKGPFSIAVAGQLNVSSLAPIVANLGNLDPVAASLVSSVLSFHGEFGFALRQAPKAGLALFAAKLADPGAVTQILIGGMEQITKMSKDDLAKVSDAISIQKVKANSLKGKGGALHEVRFKALAKELQASLTAKVTKGFVGVSDGHFLAAVGVQAQKHAQRLARPVKKNQRPDKFLAPAMAESSEKQESILIAVDPISLESKKAPGDIAPLIMGLGFQDKAITLRLHLPGASVKRLIDKAMP